MKQILLFLLIAVWSTLSFGQNIIELDLQLSGWQISGNNISMQSDYEQGDYINLLVDIENPTQNLETFTLKSPNFNLYANQLYNLEFYYVYAFFDAMMGDSQIDELNEVILKDGNGNVIQNLSLQDNENNNYKEFAEFFVANTGNYYLEFIGKIQNVTHEAQNQKYAGFYYIYLYEDDNKFSVSGRVKYDINNDNCSTSTQFLENFSIKSNPSISNNSFYSKTNINGNYITSFNEINTYTIQPDYNLITSNPVNYNLSFATPLNSVNKDFCIKSTISGSEVEISTIPLREGRPGFIYPIKIIYKNTGSLTTNGQIAMNFDNGKMNFINSTYNPSSTLASTITWDYTNLAPFETREFSVNFSIFAPPTVMAGDHLVFTTIISPTDNIPSNNTSVIDVLVINSHDPNDVIVLEGSEISLTQVSDYLHYRVRFQNTGTASAINVRVNTKLDDLLDWDTFEMIDSSHPNTVVRSNGNELNFIFDDINLADSTSNEEASHGWIFYQIKPKNTFTVNDVISNYADIYFDYNAAVVTNTATVTINPDLSTTEVNQSKIILYPNPVKDEIRLLMKDDNDFTFDYQIFDLSGKLIKTGKSISHQTINVNNLSKGIYILKLISSNQKHQLKFIKN